MTQLRTIGSQIVDADRCVYLNTHAKHPVNVRLERKIRAKRIEMGLDRGFTNGDFVVVFHDNHVYSSEPCAPTGFTELVTRPIG